MDQTEARKLAREITDAGLNAVATQESRYHGRFALPGEPWVVVLNWPGSKRIIRSREDMERIS